MKYDMLKFQELASSIEIRLIEMDRKRDMILDLSNKIIKYAGRSIESFHRGNIEQSEKELGVVEVYIKNLTGTLKDEPYFYSIGLVNVAFQEYVEAKLLLMIMKSKSFPTPSELELPEFTYILGIADLIGELRRHVLEQLVDNHVNQARECYELMKVLYDTFLNIEYGKNMAGDFRRKKDTARILLERTLSDLFVATQGQKLSEKLESI